MNLKQEAAKSAAALISHHAIVGLGAGSTIAYVIEFLKLKIDDGLQVQFVTSSFSTRQLLLQTKIPVQPVSSFKNIDIYFDGCDQLDYNLNALKSGGGIHTHEKLLASMASEFILIGDETKFVENFDTRYPLVIELLPEAISYVPGAIRNIFPGTKSNYRVSEKKDGLVITENGNYLLDIWFEKWPELSSINPALKNITGVVETSLFYQLAMRAIIAGKDGIKILESS